MDKLSFLRAYSQNDIKEAFQLVEKKYLEQNYISPDSNFSKEIPECYLAKDSAVFTAKAGDAILGTVSVIMDSSFGLPMDDIFRKELEEFRNAGKKIVEIGRLAVEKNKDISLLFSLFKLVFHYCVCKKADYLCITVNPKHSSFYNYFQFEDKGFVEKYGAVNNAPAALKVLDLGKIQEKRAKNVLLNKIFFDNPPDYGIFEG